MADTMGYVMLAMAFTMSFILLWLICCCTPSVMKTYRPVILCGWFADFTFNTSALIGRPLYFYSDGTMYCVSAMLSSLPHNYDINLIGILIWIFGFMEIIITPALQFLCRYLMVVKNIEISSHKMAVLTLLWWSILAPYMVLGYFANQPSPYYWQLASEKFGRDVTMRSDGANGTEFRYIFLIHMNSLPMRIIFVYGIVVIIATYTSIGFFGCAIYARIRKAKSLATHPQGAHHVAQRQINNILLVQAMSPPIMNGMPYVYILIMFALRLETPPWVVWIFDHILATVPIINPMFAVYFVRPYRRCVARCLGRIFGRLVTRIAPKFNTTSTQPVQMSVVHR